MSVVATDPFGKSVLSPYLYLRTIDGAQRTTVYTPTANKSGIGNINRILIRPDAQRVRYRVGGAANPMFPGVPQPIVPELKVVNGFLAPEREGWHYFGTDPENVQGDQVTSRIEIWDNSRSRLRHVYRVTRGMCVAIYMYTDWGIKFPYGAGADTMYGICGRCDDLDHLGDSIRPHAWRPGSTNSTKTSSGVPHMISKSGGTSAGFTFNLEVAGKLSPSHGQDPVIDRQQIMADDEEFRSDFGKVRFVSGQTNTDYLFTPYFEF